MAEAAGLLEYERARVRWFLSIDANTCPTQPLDRERDSQRGHDSSKLRCSPFHDNCPLMESIAVFAYEFAHRKSYDFLTDLVSLGLSNLVVIAAPKKDLGPSFAKKNVAEHKSIFAPLPTAELCQNLKLPYFVVEHDDAHQLSRVVTQFTIKRGVIAGARIIPAQVLMLFEKGIINFHPGKIPETSGLDAFAHMLKKGAPAGVTTHFIDHRVDAGRLVRFSELTINAADTPFDVQENTYQLQRMALRSLVADIANGQLPETPIDRPAKNSLMTEEERLVALALFQTWKARILSKQITTALFLACEKGDIQTIKELITVDPSLVCTTNERGWTPLIVACFNQQIDAAKVLLTHGADPNRCGANGTTPFMYAKTKVLNFLNQEYALLELLIDFGADCGRTDGFGKTVLYYVEQANDHRLAAFIRQRSAAHIA